MKYEVRFTNQFKKDIRLAKKQGKDIDKLFDVIGILANGETLAEKYRDHDLSVTFSLPMLIIQQNVLQVNSNR